MADAFTGGFDVCFEVSERALSAFASARVGGQRLTVPMPFGDSFALASVLLVAADLALVEGSRPAARVTGRFRDSSILLDGQVVGPLSGSVEVTAPFGLSDVTADAHLGDIRSLQLDFRDPAGERGDPVAVRVLPDEPSRARLDEALAPLGLDFDSVAGLAASGVRAEMASRFGAVTLDGLAVPVTRAGDGTLGVTGAGAEPTTPRFARVRLRTLAAAGGRPAVLCLLAAVLAEVGGQRVADKAVAVTDPSEHASVTLAARAFRHHVLCPVVRDLVGAAGMAVPPPCGDPADGLLRRLADRFREGRILLEARALREGFWGELSAEASAVVTVELAGDGVVTRITRFRHRIDLRVARWLDALAAIFAFPAWLAARLAIRRAMSQVDALLAAHLPRVLERANAHLASVLQQPFADLTDGLRLRSVTVHRHGIAVQARLTLPSPARLDPGLGLTVEAERNDLGIAGSGTVDGVTCIAGEYAYTDRREWQIARVRALPRDLGDQVSFRWTVAGQEVPAGQSERRIAASTFDGSPLPEPARFQLILSPEGRQLVVNHSPPEGNALVRVRCVAMSAGGTSAAAGVDLDFRAHRREFEERYAEDLSECIRQRLRDMGRGPVEWPPPDGSDPLAVWDRIRGELGPLILHYRLVNVASTGNPALARMLQRAGLDDAWLRPGQPPQRPPG